MSGFILAFYARVGGLLSGGLPGASRLDPELSFTPTEQTSAPGIASGTTGSGGR